MKLSQIAAMAKNRVIGSSGELPWHIPKDLKYFKSKTKGHIIIMGRKTFESLGTGHPLPNRLNVVVTRSKNFDAPEGVHVFNTIENAIKFCSETVTNNPDWPEEVFICGGSEIYLQTLDICDRLYITELEKEFGGDTFFPEFQKSEFDLISEDKETEPFPYSFNVYERKSKNT